MVSKQPVSIRTIYDPYDNLSVKYRLSWYALLSSFPVLLMPLKMLVENPLNDLLGICVCTSYYTIKSPYFSLQAAHNSLYYVEQHPLINVWLW